MLYGMNVSTVHYHRSCGTSLLIITVSTFLELCQLAHQCQLTIYSYDFQVLQGLKDLPRVLLCNVHLLNIV